MKLRYKRGGKYWHEWFVFVSQTESLESWPLYEFTERRKLIRIVSGHADVRGKVQVYNPTDGAPIKERSIVSSRESIGVMLGALNLK